MISSTDFVYALGSTESVNGWIFAKFLNGLRDFIEEKIQIEIREWLIIIDNARTHHSKLVTDYINRQKLCVAYPCLHFEFWSGGKSSSPPYELSFGEDELWTISDEILA